MNIVLWIIAGVLAVLFLATGLMKLLQPKETLAASGMAWTEDFSAGSVKLIGGLEVLAAIGLILPGIFDTATVLVPLAATGLVLVMGGAAILHIRRKEPQGVVMTLVLLVLAATVAIGRF